MKFTPGQQITAGSLLVVLDHDSQTAALQEATSTLQHLQLQWQRAQQLRAKQLISQADADNTESELAVAKARVAVADSQLQKRFVRAPFSGRVGLRRVDIGTVVNASTVLTTLDDLRQIYVGFQVPEQHLRQLKAGQTVLARSPAFANETFRGELAEIDTRVDANTRAFRVRAAFANPQQQLIAGLSMRLELTLAERPQALLVPEEAVLSQDQSRYVFVIHDDQAQRTEVQLGTRMPGQIEILKGLEADQEIVIKGQQNLSDQSRIRRATAAP